MPIEEYRKRIREAKDDYTLSSLIGLAYVDAEITATEYEMILDSIRKRQEALRKNAKEEEAMRKTRERLNG